MRMRSFVGVSVCNGPQSDPLICNLSVGDSGVNATQGSGGWRARNASL